MVRAALLVATAAGAFAARPIKLPLNKKHVTKQKLVTGADGADDIHTVNMLEYYVNLSVGTPAQPFHVSIDTGSGPLGVVGNDMTQQSCRSVPGHHYYDRSKSSTWKNSTSGSYEFDYSAGSITGVWSKDVLHLAGVDLQVEFGESATVDSHPRANGSGYTCFHDFSDGLMGLVPHATDEPPSPPNVIDDLYDAGEIDARQYAFAGEEFIIGGDDDSLYEGELTYHNCSGPDAINKDSHWLFKSYGFNDPSSNESNAQLFATMQDTGAVATHGAAWAIAPAMNKVAAALAGRDKQLAACDADVISSLPTITFYMYGQSFDMHPEDYVFKDEETNGDCVVGFQIDSPAPIPLCLGDTFIQAHYMSCHIDYPSTSKRIAFAPLKGRSRRSRAAKLLELTR
jgi:hypothetical protein